MASPFKIAIISHEGGGISSVSYGLANGLAKKNIQTTIFTSEGTRNEIRRLSDYVEIIYMPTFAFPPRAFWFQVLNMNKLLKSLKDHAIIHGVSPDASFLFTFLKKKLSKPFVGTIHGSPRTLQRAFLDSPISSWTKSEFAYNVIEYPLHDLTVNRVLDSSDHATVCSFTTLEELKSYRRLDTSRISVIYNGVDLDEIQGVVASKREEDDVLSLMYAGRLYWTKGVMLLLEAFKRIVKDYPNVRLTIFGSGPLEESIRRFIGKNHFEGNIRFKGHVSHTRLLAEVKNCDVVVFPSLSEAQPVFALEAMACGKPLVCFNIPSMCEIVSDMKNGLLAETPSVQDFCEKISILLSNEDLRLEIGNNALEYVRKKHNWDLQATEYLKIYESLVKT